MQASAPRIADFSSGVENEEAKSGSAMRLTVSLALEIGRSRRDSATMEVIEGWARHWERISWPMKPVEPVRMIFILFVYMACVGGIVG